MRPITAISDPRRFLNHVCSFYFFITAMTDETVKWMAQHHKILIKGMRVILKLITRIPQNFFH
jgi:hypothetical protein